MEKKERKISKPVKALMWEAYRRSLMKNNIRHNEPLTNRWLGLGTASAYKPVIEKGYMKFYDGDVPPRRCMGWLVLTEEGVKVFNSLLPEFKERMTLAKSLGYEKTICANYQLAGGITTSRKGK